MNCLFQKILKALKVLLLVSTNCEEGGEEEIPPGQERYLKEDPDGDMKEKEENSDAQ